MKKFLFFCLIILHFNLHSDKKSQESSTFKTTEIIHENGDRTVIHEHSGHNASGEYHFSATFEHKYFDTYKHVHLSNFTVGYTPDHQDEISHQPQVNDRQDASCHHEQPTSDNQKINEQSANNYFEDRFDRIEHGNQHQKNDGVQSSDTTTTSPQNSGPVNFKNKKSILEHIFGLKELKIFLSVQINKLLKNNVKKILKKSKHYKVCKRLDNKQNSKQLKEICNVTMK